MSESYPPTPGAPAAARRFGRSTLAAALGDGAGELIGDIELVISELVTNAVDARATSIDVTLLVHRSVVRVEVGDDAAGRPRLTTPDPGSHRGRGLMIVAGLATDWGVAADDDRKWVWAEFALS